MHTAIEKTDTQALRFRVTPGKVFLMAAVNMLIAFFVHAAQPDSVFTYSLIYSQCIGIAIAACTITAVNRFKLRSLGFQIGLISLAVCVGAVVGMWAGGALVSFIAPSGGHAAGLDGKYLFHTPNLLYALLFGAIVSYVFMSLQRLSDEKIKRLEAEKSAAVTEIRLLQSQMEPHFLFNTLSNILGLIDEDPKKASRMLQSFTVFLRSSLVTARSETITLGQEMDVVKNYLDIFSVRMGERLRYRLDVPDDLREVRVPPLLIQPLVENAIKHGLEPSLGGGDLQVKAEKDGDTVRVRVTDTGAGIREAGSSTGIGLDNIKKRLELLYGGRARLTFEENLPTGVKATVVIPE